MANPPNHSNPQSKWCPQNPSHISPRRHSSGVNGAVEQPDPLQPGHVTLVGAGPGHPDYLTLKGLRALETADVVVYDALLDTSFPSLFPPSAQSFYVGKRCGKHYSSQAEINALLIEQARLGHHVARLKGGDPYVFGRGGEEVLALRQAGIEVSVVPGVSSLNGVGALASIPLTHRGISRKVMFLECHAATLYQQPWDELARFDGTLVLFMSTKTIGTICGLLIDHGMGGQIPLALVENASFPTETVTLSSVGAVARGGLKPKTTGPGLIYIGEVVGLHYALTGEEPVSSVPLSGLSSTAGMS